MRVLTLSNKKSQILLNFILFPSLLCLVTHFEHGDNPTANLLLEKCKIPIKLQHLTYSDMTIEQDFVFEMRRLKRALLPEVL
jgi:hypothetical protein